MEDNMINIVGVIVFLLIILSLANASSCKSYRGGCRCSGSQCTCGGMYNEYFKKSNENFSKSRKLILGLK